MSAITRRAVLAAGAAALAAGCAPSPRGAPPAPTPAAAGLGDLKERTFRYFWETTDGATGLAPDRWPARPFASIAAIGFALTALPIGEANGWITRAQGRARALTTLRFLFGLPQTEAQTGVGGHKGFFYHFLRLDDGLRYGTTELSTIDTALLLGGVLLAQSWYDRADADEAAIRRLADDLYARVDWAWIRPRPPFVAMGWDPAFQFLPSDWNEFNEAHLLYVLALGSPTSPLPVETWRAWTDTFAAAWDTQRGEPHTGFAPLFGHQYSQVWLDLRGVADPYARARGIDWFENSRRAAFAQRLYAQANPLGFTGYGGDEWGLTACDGPGDFWLKAGGRERRFFAYSARGPGERDDGTIAPTAAGGSVAHAPEIAIPALAHFRRRYGEVVYGRYGFLDAFNRTLAADPPFLRHGRMVPGFGWVDTDYLGIDQGPILAMLENHDTGLVWRTMRTNAHVRRGLERAGFTGGWLGGAR